MSKKARKSKKGKAFLLSFEWRRLRMIVLDKRGARCECCGATPAHGVRINVDHIQPKKRRPDLALTESNLQVLCEECNRGKGNWDQTDWRGKADPVDDYTQNAPVLTAYVTPA